MRRFCWAENYSYRRRAPLNPSSTNNPSKLIQPNAPAPAFNGALADEVGADDAVPVAVPCSVTTRGPTEGLPTKLTFQVAVRVPAAVGTN